MMMMTNDDKTSVWVAEYVDDDGAATLVGVGATVSQAQEVIDVAASMCADEDRERFMMRQVILGDVDPVL